MSVEGISRVASLFGAGTGGFSVAHKMKRQIGTDPQGKTTLLCARVTASRTGSHMSNERILLGTVQPNGAAAPGKSLCPEDLGQADVHVWILFD
jgi:hypothetical protein